MKTYMKKLWRLRFFILIIIGLIMLLIGALNSLVIWGMIMWSSGFVISMIGILFQIIMAPNYEKKNEVNCPDCGATLKIENNKLEFIKHN